MSAMTPRGGEREGQSDSRKRGVRRTAFWMSLLAFAIYATFIIASVLRA